MSNTSPGLGQDCAPVVFSIESLQKCLFQQNAWRWSQDMGKAGADRVRVLLPLSSLSARGDARPGMQHPAADCCEAVQDKGKSGANLARLLLPLSSLSGWGLVAVGALMVMHVLGFNIQPLLTVGGVGGLAFGFGAQAVTSNAISGLNLFLTRPFVIGGACVM